MKKEKQEIEGEIVNNNDLESPISEEKKDSPTIEKTVAIPNVKYTRPPAFVKWNNQFRWSQNNFSKSIQRKSSWRGR